MKTHKPPPSEVPKSVTVQVDDREKFPYTFAEAMLWHCAGEPHAVCIRTERLRLVTGDYRLREYPRAAGLDTKRSTPELVANLFGSVRQRTNFIAALDRMASEFTHPYLVLDVQWSALFAKVGGTVGRRGQRTGPYREYTPAEIHDRLIELCEPRGVMISGPIAGQTPDTRRLAGMWWLRRLFFHAMNPRALRNDKLAEAMCFPETPYTETWA